METIVVNVQWCDKNFGASFSDNVPGAVVFTAKTFSELQKEAKESLDFHLECMKEDGDEVPQWWLDGDYKFEYNLADATTVLRASTSTCCRTMPTASSSHARSSGSA